MRCWRPARDPRSHRAASAGRSRARGRGGARGADELLATERRSVPSEPSLTADGVQGNWDIEFFDGARYNAARNRRAPQGYGSGA